MVKTRCAVLLLVISLFFICIANATTLTHLYEVSVPVFSQSADERKIAIGTAFEELLIRITGKREVLYMASGQALLGKSRRFVRSFRYEVLPPPSVFETEQSPLMEEEKPLTIEEARVATDVLPSPKQKIIVSFDEAAVKNSLWKQALPVWGKTRPSTLLWVAVQDEEGREMLDASKLSEMSEAIKAQSEKRGVPLVYPRLDLADQLKVNVTDVWGVHKDPVINASLRYRTEAVISARFFLDPLEGWQTHWSLFQSGDEITWRINAADLSEVIYEGIDKLAGILADRYAQVSIGSSGEDRFLIRIKGVDNLTDYEKINRYLNAISMIKHAELVQIQSDELVYELELRTDPGALKQAIALGKILFEQNDPFADEVDINRLNYRFVP